MKEAKSLMCFWSCGYQAAQRMNTPAKYIVGTSTIPFNPSAFGEVNIKDQFKNSSLGNKRLLSYISVWLFFPQIICYLRMCLAYSAGATPVSTRLGAMQDDAPAIGRYVQTLLSSEHQPSGSKGAEANPVHVYVDLLQQLLSAGGGERS